MAFKDPKDPKVFNVPNVSKDPKNPKVVKKFRADKCPPCFVFGKLYSTTISASMK